MSKKVYNVIRFLRNNNSEKIDFSIYQLNMSNKSVKKNMFMSILLTSANVVFPLITFSYVTRVLGPEGTGKVAFVTSIISYFSYIAILGIPSYGVREVAKVRDNKNEVSRLACELLLINLISTTVSYILLILSVLFVPRLYEERMLFVAMSVSIILQTIGLEWLYQAFEEYEYITIRSLFFKVISVLLTFLLIRSKSDFLIYGVITIFTTSASYLFNFFHIKKFITFDKFEIGDIKKHIKPIMTLFTASIIITIYSNFDVIMIGFIKNDYEVGLYNAALKIKNLVLSLSTSVTSVIVPRMSYYLKNKDKENAINLIEKSLRVSLCLAIPIALFIIIVGKESISFFCGDEYSEAISTLRVLMVCILSYVLANLFGNQILIPSGDEKRFSQSVLVGMIINLSLNSILIPIAGSFGAAIATLATECWNAFWMSGGSAGEYRKIIFKKINILVYALPMVVSLIAVLLLSVNLKVQVFWYLVITSFVYFGLYYSLLIIEKEPIITTILKNLRNYYKSHINKNS